MVVNKIFHCTYCTNIHGGKNWELTFNDLKNYIPKIKEDVAPNSPFGIGLRLSNKASEELQIGNNLLEFKTWLDSKNLYVFTMNGFPYGNFHDEVVKDKVHTPDWTTTKRLNYTKRLFNQLAYILPEGLDGGISTSPLSYKHWHKTTIDKEYVFTEGAKNLAKVVCHLVKIEQETGKYLHLDIEPEPDGVLENTEEFLAFYNDYLLPQGSEIISEVLKISSKEAEELIYRHMTICYDVCHFSLAFEEPKDTFEKLKKHNIKVGKIQVSSALKINFDGHNDEAIWESLSNFNESTYLHQVTEKIDGVVIVYNDLPLVLGQKKSHNELRAHFHVPIFLDTFNHLQSTQNQILEVMDHLKTDAISNHIEVETYTWNVLPNNLKIPIDQSISRELNWLLKQF
ncbi:metabolite traffic protein EboE [Winogradskyella sp. PG-2]|uniref:metabolite traffic protein EboE n=1 Tax=Winogradskyella sp. PG-2 TaxID=754409 RepID=UPI000458913D|nr:metabolite traffic protein EboE [Winogradskyella sp. PG-2]BAO75278.1 hypothetical protein WPG_1048 [Winogradskyella sp. PG-2]